MFENPNCTECKLHVGKRSVCMPSRGGADCSLAIFLDYPNSVEDKRRRSFVSDNAAWVDHSLLRMSVPLDRVYMDYMVKCAPGKMPGVKSERMGCVAACSEYRLASLQAMPNLRAVVVLGSLGCEAMTGMKEIGQKAGAEWKPLGFSMQQLIEHVWIGNSPGLLKEKPSEAGTIFRVIWKAAEEAQLNPKIDPIVKPYVFDI